MRTRFVLGALAAVVASVPTPLLPQTTQGVILGRVVDAQSGRPVDQADVRATHISIGLQRLVETSSTGYYLLPLLPPGLYHIRVTVRGYQAQEVYGLRLAVAGQIELNLRMRPLDDVWERNLYKSVFLPESETVLPFYGPDVDTSQFGVFTATRGTSGSLESTVSEVIDPAAIRELPFPGRDLYTMLVTQAGVTADAATARGIGLSVNGQRPSASNFMLDGVENNNYLVTGPLTIVAPESAQEYRVSLSNFSAEYGRTSGYIANVVTKSGTNEWHGIVYLNSKNDALNANDFQDNRKGVERRPLRETQTGFHVGGPGRKNLLFVSAAFEYFRSRSRGEEIQVKVPAPSFAENFTAPGSLARRLLTEFPVPTADEGDGITTNLDIRPPVSTNRYTSLVRADYVSPSGAHRLMGRFALGRVERPDFIWYPYEEFTSGLEQPNYGLALNYTRVFRPSLVSEFKLGWSSDDLRWDRPRFEVPTLGIAQTLLGPGDKPEDVLRPTLLPGSPAFYEFQNQSRNWELAENLVWSIDSHIIKLGGGALIRGVDGFLTAGRDGRYIFDNIFSFSIDQPRLFSAALSRQSLPSFQSPRFEREYEYKQFYLFLQDSWRVSSPLVLNLGVRYERLGAPSNVGSVKDTLVALGPGSTFAERLAAGGLVLPTESTTNLFETDTNDVAVRFGFSYRLADEPSTILRGSYGIFYDRPFDNLWQNIRNNSFVLADFDYRPGAGGDLGYFAPIASVLPAYEDTFFLKTFPDLTLVDSHLRNTYVQNYFVGIQQQLGVNWSVEVNTLGSLGRKLITTDIVNRQFSSALTTDNPQGRFNPDLPNIAYRAGQGKSNYNALASVLRYRARRGFFQIAYTWSHTIDNQSDPLLGDFFDLSFTNIRAQPSGGRATFALQFDSSADRGDSDFDQRHNLVLFSNWEIPTLFSSSSLRSLFRDWRIAQIAAFRTGFPYTVLAPSLTLPGIGQIINQRADIIDPGATQSRDEGPIPGGKVLLNSTVGEGFGFPPRGTLGNSGRNAFRGPGLFSIDISVERSFQAPWLGETGRLKFRADVFNVLNHANLNNPHALLGSSSFGHALYGRRGRTGGFPALTPFDETARQVQLMLRLEF